MLLIIKTEGKRKTKAAKIHKGITKLLSKKKKKASLCF